MHTYVKLIEIFHVVQELWSFSLNANGRTDRQTPTGREIMYHAISEDYGEIPSRFHFNISEIDIC